MFNRIRYSSIIAILFFMQSSTKFVKSQLNDKVSLDLVIVLHDGMQKDPVRWGKVRDGLNELPTIFKFGDTLTRGTIVANEFPHGGSNGLWMSIKDVTGNEAAFRKAINDTKWSASIDKGLYIPFRALNQTRFERSTAILLLTTSAPPSDVDLDLYAKNLRESDVWIFAIVDGAVSDADMKRLTGFDKSHVIKIGGMTSDGVKTALREFKNKIDGLICSKENTTSDCFYTNEFRSKCVEGWYTPNLTLSTGDCTNIWPTPTPTPTALKCDLSDCRATCERLWGPFAPCVCNQSVDRIGELKWKFLEACGRQLKCKPCPTTTSTTLAPSTIPSTIETTPSKPKSKGPSAGYIALAFSVPALAILMFGAMMLKFEMKERRLEAKQTRILSRGKAKPNVKKL